MTGESKSLRNAQIVAVVLLIFIAYLCYRAGYFSSMAALQRVVNRAGVMGPTVFILLQTVQVIFPIIPGGLSTVAAIAIFGAKWGFVYNYIGIAIGSMLSFSLVRHYGRRFVRFIVPEKTLDKYQHYLDGGKGFDRFFTIAILMPIAPDDLLCMIAGLTKMPRKKFVTIIMLCKPVTILEYSLGLSWVFTTVGKLIH
ncbi:TVP38/TMEM64 family protein [Lacticaseibacillus zhaodongensis]|uniref:TVP38/TMEM64 family protein n=1 Tax=Lacticaseibacillus zhaodongensis TaxID=2668065 RepID=UPI0012D33122|nr:TVP38/TMEM64 family protein [Lacticaseibacillus zhaodongensis]